MGLVSPGSAFESLRQLRWYGSNGKSRRMVSARPQFDPACQLQSLLVWHSGSRESLYLSDECSIRSTSSRCFMAGLAEWL